ncbi:MAG: hypothetical protein RIC35_09370 [Marinoscillum sp.]
MGLNFYDASCMDALVIPPPTQSYMEMSCINPKIHKVYLGRGWTKPEMYKVYPGMGWTNLGLSEQVRAEGITLLQNSVTSP